MRNAILRRVSILTAGVSVLLSITVFGIFLPGLFCHATTGSDASASKSSLPVKPAAEKQAGGIEKDPYLGLKVAELGATGFFRLERLGDRIFLVTPDGHPFIRIGINGLTPWYGQYRKASFKTRYKGDVSAWGKEAIERVRSWGFNTLEYKTAKDLIRLMITGKVERMPYTIMMPFVENVALKRSEFPDVFSPEFQATADSVAREHASKVSKDPYLLGYYLGNELDFDLSGGRAWRSRWVRNLLRKGRGTPAFKAFVDLAKEKHGDIESFNKSYGTSLKSFEELNAKSIGTLLKEDSVKVVSIIRDYNGLLAEQFYKVTSTAIKKYDTNHLILGSRFGSGAEPEVLRKTARYTDIVSLNKYTLNKEKLLEEFAEFYRLTGKPLHHSEFSFLIRGRHGGTGGGKYPPVDSQRERGEYYRKFVQAEIRVPYVIGFSWYEYMDSGDDDANFGLIDKEDNIYEEPVSIIAQANKEVEASFAETIRSLAAGGKGK